MWRTIIPVDVCWQILQVVWSIADARHDSIHYSKNIPCQVGRKLRCTKKGDGWLRTPVRIRTIPQIVTTSEHQEYPHYSVPSPSKWQDRKTTPQPEGFTTRGVDQHQMVGTITTDTPETSHNGEDGVELFSCRSFVRNHIAVTSTILPPPKKVVDMPSFINRLSSKMFEMAYSPVGQNRRDKTYTPKLLKTCNQVFIRDTAWTNSLQPPYREPYKVVTKNDKYHTVLIKNTPQTISIDRLKPVMLEDKYLEVTTPNISPPVLPQPQKQSSLKTTRSGWQVRWPKHFKDFVSK